MELLIFLGSLFFFMCFGVPLAVVLVLCSIVLMFHSGMWDAMIIPNTMLDGTNNYPLMAIPFFVFAGEIMAAGGLSKRVVALAEVMVGRIRGGLGYAAIVASIIFAGLMGSSVGEAAALGGLLLPMMQQVGYDKGRAGAVIASGAILGPIIPPSTNFIILGATISGLSITKLFMIGLTPGIMIGLILMIVWWFIVRKDGYHNTQTFTAAQVWAIVKDSTPAFMMPVLLLGGIRFGVFTPTEGGAFAAIYAIVVCMLYYRELSIRELIRQDHSRGHVHRGNGLGSRLLHHPGTDPAAGRRPLPAAYRLSEAPALRHHGLHALHGHGHGSDPQHSYLCSRLLPADPAGQH